MLADEPQFGGDAAARGHVPMRQHATLGPAGGAGRVDDQRWVVRSHLGGAPRHLRRVTVPSQAAQLLEGGRLAVDRVDDQDVPKLGQPVADRLDLGQLRGVLADHRDGAGVADHPLALFRRAGRVDRHHDRAGGGDAELRLNPLRTGVGQHTHPVSRLHPERDQALRDLAGGVPQRGVGQILPGAVALEPLRGTRPEPFCTKERKLCDCLCHGNSAHAGLRVTPAGRGRAAAPVRGRRRRRGRLTVHPSRRRVRRRCFPRRCFPAAACVAAACVAGAWARPRPSAGGSRPAGPPGPPPHREVDRHPGHPVVVHAALMLSAC